MSVEFPNMSGGWPWPQNDKQAAGWHVTQTDSGTTFLIGPKGETYRWTGDKWRKCEGGPA